MTVAGASSTLLVGRTAVPGSFGMEPSVSQCPISVLAFIYVLSKKGTHAGVSGNNIYLSGVLERATMYLLEWG